MKNVVIFGAGTLGGGIFEKIKDKEHIVSFWDNYKTGRFQGIPIEKPHFTSDIDVVYLATSHEGIREQLIGLGIDEGIINDYYIEHPFTVRNNWLRNYAEFLRAMQVKGSVAEAGVFRGDFACWINRFFEADLYLFDTFEGFASCNVEVERANSFSIAQVGQFGNTSEEIVMGKMKFPDRVRLVKGMFPQSAIEMDIPDRFMFVNLDMDLYQPTYEGLNYFCPKMVRHGVILVHDYFTHYQGIEKAVNQFLSNHPKLQAIPIGDEMSVAVVGFGSE